MTQNFARAALSAALCSSLLMVSALAAAGPIEDGVKLLEAQRYAEATKLFQKEAAKDNPRAMYYLGDMLNQGLGTHRQYLPPFKKGYHSLICLKACKMQTNAVRPCKTSPTISTTFTFERPHSGHNYHFYLPIVAELISVSS